MSNDLVPVNASHEDILAAVRAMHDDVIELKERVGYAQPDLYGEIVGKGLAIEHHRTRVRVESLEERWSLVRNRIWTAAQVLGVAGVVIWWLVADPLAAVLKPPRPVPAAQVATS